jgi:hypothetical protein
VTSNEPERDPCHCGSKRCRGSINFDVSDAEAHAFARDDEAGRAFRRRLDEYEAFLRSIGQEQVFETIAARIQHLRAAVG